MLGGWAWVIYRVGGIGDASTDGRDSAVVLTNEFRPNCGSQPPFLVAQRLALGAGCRRQDGNECRLTGHYSGHLSHENAIATHDSKLRQHAAQREAV